jgi:hypothetical protein
LATGKTFEVLRLRARLSPSRYRHALRRRLKTVAKKPLDSSITFWYYYSVDSKHRKTLEVIFEKPERANIAWRDIEALFIALGAELSEGNGSRVRIAMKDVRAVFHRPHPRKETNKGAVKSVRRFLEAAGVKP